MLKDVLSGLDYSLCAEIALALFFAVFTFVLLSTLRLSRQATDRFASIPLSDEVEDPRT